MTSHRTAGGQCYRLAVEVAQELVEKAGLAEDEVRIIHGRVSGEGRLRGTRYTHAWVEASEAIVLDDRIAVRRETYYDRGDVREEELVAYTLPEAREQMLATGHFGPWG